jgi:hypothetical protein
VFKAPKGKLTTGKQTTIKPLNGALPKNIYWVIGSDVQLGQASHMYGTVLTPQNMNFLADATIVGHALPMQLLSFQSASTIAIPYPIVMESLTSKSKKL